MALILTYQEKRLGTSYTYKLFDDQIVIRDKTFLLENAGVIVPLEILNPQPTQIWRREPVFKFALCMAILMALASCYTGATEGWTSGAFYSHILCLLIAVGLTTIWSQRFEFIEFQDDQGVVHLAMTQGKNQAQRFNEFAQTITQHIRIARQIE